MAAPTSYHGYNLDPSLVNQMPMYESLIDPATGLLKSQYQLQKPGNVQMGSILPELGNKLSGINFDDSSINTLKGFANGSGDSPWSSAARATSDQQTKQGMDDAAKRGTAGTADAWSQLAATGGLDSGARERVAMNGTRNQYAGQQQVAQQGAQNQLGITQQNEANRFGTLNAMPGMEATKVQSQLATVNPWLQQATTEQGRNVDLDINNRNFNSSIDQNNIKGAQDEYHGAYGAQTQNWQELMKAWAANQQAKATAESGSGGSWICTEVDKVEPLSIHQWGQLKHLLRWSRENAPDQTEYYLKIGPEIVAKMKANGANFGDLRDFVYQVIALVEADRMLDAYSLYKAKAYQLLDSYFDTEEQRRAV